MMTNASRRLTLLARRVGAAYLSEAGPQAILLVGSAAGGVSDDSSDLDLILYYDRLPSEARVVAARVGLQAMDFRVEVRLTGQLASGTQRLAVRLSPVVRGICEHPEQIVVRLLRGEADGTGAAQGQANSIRVFGDLLDERVENRIASCLVRLHQTLRYGA
jgi:hypothetical protein